MLFKSNGKFIDDITDSFNRFGIQTRLSEKGTSKNTQKFEMYDSIHDSGYVAVAVEKPAGKTAVKEWENIIENDLLPTLVNENNASSSPASALIVPSKDIDAVEKMLINKGLAPSVYQLFPGYVVAGINKKDTAKLVKDYNNRKENERKKEEQKKEETSKDNEPLPVKKEEKKQAEKPVDNKVEDIEKKKAETLNSLSNIENKKPNKVSEKPQKQNIKEQKPVNKDKPKPNSSFAKKLAAAALLGTAIGAGAVAAPEISSQLNKYSTPKEAQIEKEVLEKAAEKYFDGIKNGFDENDELLKLISENPNLAQEYINELANTPVQTSALKNSSADENLLREKAKSDNESIRAAVAENPNTPKDVLEELYKDKSNNVLKSLAKNPSISNEMMDNLSNYSGLHNDMMENPALTPELMRKITAGKNRDCEFNKRYMSNPCIPTEELLYNLNNPDECIREGIALNPNTPAEAIEKLSEDKNPVVKSAAYKHKNMPQEKLNELFPENWVREPDNAMKEAERLAALENTNISPEIRKKAVFMEPEKYGMAVATNKATSPELINKMKNMAQGKKGVHKLLYDIDNIKNNPKELAEIKKQMEQNKEALEKPVRRLMNKKFVENVYDPYELIEDMRRIPSSNKKNNLKNNGVNTAANTGNNAGNSGGSNSIVPGSETASSSILDKNGNAPELFSSMPLPPLSKGAVSYNPEAEKQALKTADNIIESMMNDSVAGIEKALNSPSFNNNGGSEQNNGSSLADVPNGLGGLSTGQSIPYNQQLSGKNKKIYENACREIDQLKKMF